MLVAWELDKSIIMREISTYSYHNSAKNPEKSFLEFKLIERSYFKILIEKASINVSLNSDLMPCSQHWMIELR